MYKQCYNGGIHNSIARQGGNVLIWPLAEWEGKLSQCNGQLVAV